MKVLVLFYSAHGHVYQMAKAVAEGVKSIDGVEVALKKVPETLDPRIMEATGIAKAQEAYKDIEIATVGELSKYDAIIFGTPTRFGMMASQMKAFLDGTGGLWAQGTLVGKIGSVFTSTGTQHGGQETTIQNFHSVLLHHGMIVVGLPYSFAGQSTMAEISGGSPYGASTIAGDGTRWPSQNELDGAFYQGAHVAGLVKRLSGK